MDRPRSGRSRSFGGAIVAALGASLAIISAAWSAPLPDGNWTIQGRGVMGTGCGDWFVRLNSLHGQLSGIVGVAKGNVSLRNITLLSSGAFTASTPDTWDGPRHIRGYHVTGSFTGDRITVTIENRFCPTRIGSVATGVRH